MTLAMSSFLVGWFLPAILYILRTPLGAWQVGVLLLDSLAIRFVFAVIFGVAGKIIWE